MGEGLRETGCVGLECIVYVYEVVKKVHFKEKRKESLVVSKASHRGNLITPELSPWNQTYSSACSLAPCLTQDVLVASLTRCP